MNNNHLFETMECLRLQLQLRELKRKFGHDRAQELAEEALRLEFHSDLETSLPVPDHSGPKKVPVVLQWSNHSRIKWWWTTRSHLRNSQVRVVLSHLYVLIAYVFCTVPPQYLTPKLNTHMKTKPNVIASARLTKLKRKDVIAHPELYIVTHRGEAITIAVVDEDISHSQTPRYSNTVYAQYASAENACAKLNAQFNTDAFEVRTIRCPK